MCPWVVWPNYFIFSLVRFIHWDTFIFGGGSCLLISCFGAWPLLPLGVGLRRWLFRAIGLLI